MKKSEWVFACDFYVKGKTKINIIFYQNDIALAYVNVIKCLWNIYEICLTIDLIFVIIKSFVLQRGIVGFKHILKLKYVQDIWRYFNYL